MSIILKIEAKQDAINKRLAAAQHNIQSIIDEKRKLDYAHGVVTKLLKEDGDGASKQKDDPGELTTPKLILMILEKSPRPLRPFEIRETAMKEYGREIGTGRSHAALAYFRKSGRLTNSDGLWSIAGNPQPERTDPVERSEDDNSDNLSLD